MSYPLKVTWNDQWRHYVVENRLRWMFMFDASLFDFFNSLEFLEKDGEETELRTMKTKNGDTLDLTIKTYYFDVIVHHINQKIKVEHNDIVLYNKELGMFNNPLDDLYDIETGEQYELLREIMKAINKMAKK
jgi:hypothetical protein